MFWPLSPMALPSLTSQVPCRCELLINLLRLVWGRATQVVLQTQPFSVAATLPAKTLSIHRNSRVMKVVAKPLNYSNKRQRLRRQTSHRIYGTSRSRSRLSKTLRIATTLHQAPTCKQPSWIRGSCLTTRIRIGETIWCRRLRTTLSESPHSDNRSNSSLKQDRSLKFHPWSRSTIYIIIKRRSTRVIKRHQTTNWRTIQATLRVLNRTAMVSPEANL